MNGCKGVEKALTPEKAHILKSIQISFNSFGFYDVVTYETLRLPVLTIKTLKSCFFDFLAQRYPTLGTCTPRGIFACLKEYI